MVREANYQELLRIATEQLVSIRDCISKKQQDEIENAKKNQKELNHTFYRMMESEQSDSIKFSIGLQNFSVKIEINTLPGSESFSLKTYEIIDNADDYGKLKLVPKPELNVSGNFMMLQFDRDATKYGVDREKIGISYLRNLLTVMDGQTKFDFSFA